MKEKKDTINILWTSSDLITVDKMIFMYALNSKKKVWWDEVNIIIWGGSSKLIAEDENIQKKIKDLIRSGIHFFACKACADQLGVTEILEKNGIEVKYVGETLTNILKSDEKLMTI